MKMRQSLWRKEMDTSVKDTLLECRCVRKYENRAISDDDVAFIH